MGYFFSRKLGGCTNLLRAPRAIGFHELNITIYDATSWDMYQLTAAPDKAQVRLPSIAARFRIEGEIDGKLFHSNLRGQQKRRSLTQAAECHKQYLRMNITTQQELAYTVAAVVCSLYG